MTYQPQSTAFNTPTEPRRTEEQLRRDARRDAFRVKLHDTLRALTDPVKIQAEAVCMIGEQLEVSWAFYSEIETIDGKNHYIVRQDYHAKDVPSSVGYFRANDFGEFVYNKLDTGNTFIVQNLETDERITDEVRSRYASLQIQAWIAVPLIKGGNLIGAFGVIHKTPRVWTADEISLIEDAAERTWAVIERTRAEEALRQSEEKYRTLFNSIDEGFCLAEVIFDDANKPVDLLVLEINQAWDRQTGLGNITGKRTTSVVSSAIGAQWINMFGRVALTGKPERMEEYSPMLKRWYNLFASRVGGEHSHTVALVFDDVTERKKAQDQIEKANQRLNQILTSIQDDFYVLDRDWVFTYASKLFTSRIGKEPEDFVGNNIWEMFPKHLGTALEKNFRAAMEKREIRRFEIPGKYTNAWYRMTAFPSAEGITVIGTEITDRKLAEEALRQSDARYQMLHETLRDALVQVNMEARIVSGNDAYCQLLGYSHEELSTLTYQDLTPGRWHAFEEGIVRDQIMTRGFSDVYEKEYRRKDGKIIPVELRTVLMRDPAGQPSMMWAIVRDITERKQAEKTLRENERQLQSLNESLEQKVGEKTAELRRLASDLTKAEQRERNRISHILHDDFQQRIYSIQMQLAILQGEIQEENESARREVDDLEKQVRGILNIARQLSVDLNPPILRDEGLLHAIHWLAGQILERYGLRVEIQADGEFAIADEELHILLFNCVRELLFNVVKHAKANQVVVTLQWSGPRLQIEVRDNGLGFPASASKYLTNGNADGAEPPSSFGLPTIRHQLSLYGGSMEIKSEPGAGTQVILIVPIHAEEQRM